LKSHSCLIKEDPLDVIREFYPLCILWILLFQDIWRVEGIFEVIIVWKFLWVYSIHVFAIWDFPVLIIWTIYVLSIYDSHIVVIYNEYIDDFTDLFFNYLKLYLKYYCTNIFLAAMNYFYCQDITLNCAHLLVFLMLDRIELVRLD